MRLTIFISVLFAWNVSANVFSQKIHFEYAGKSTSIKNVLEVIEDQTDYTFFYNDAFLDMNRPVKVEKKDVEVGELLSTIFEGTNLTYKEQENKFIVVTPKAVTEVQQGIVITGVVTDINGETLPGASIVVKGTTIGTATDVDGKYNITIPAPNAILVFTSIGYLRQEHTVGNKNVLNVKLLEDSKTLDEVVVVGYGTLKRSEVTAAVSTLNEKNFNTTAAPSSVLELAKGKIPGVVITNANGSDPRQGTDIQIRGVGSLRGSKSPLIVIDGVPGGSLSLVQPEDVESFSVLKDASAAAIYGTRGSNGVVLITTKKAKRGELKPTFDYSGYLSHDYIYKQPDILTADEYRQYMQTGGYNANMMVDFGGNTNWSDLLYDESNISQNHNLSMSGGSVKSNYRASVYYRDNNPIAIQSDQSNWGGRMNVNHLGLNDRLEVQLGATANFRTRNETGANGAWEQVAQRNPTEPAKDRANASYFIRIFNK